MTMLVTGAAGFIGMHLALRLARDGADVVGVDNFDPYYDVALKRARADQLARAGVRCIELDLADHAATEALFRDGRYTRVAHLAAQPGVRYSLQNPAAYIRNNIDAFGAVIVGETDTIAVRQNHPAENIRLFQLARQRRGQIDFGLAFGPCQPEPDQPICLRHRHRPQ